MTIVAAIALTPFWSWLEATTGVESLGHSGPADWCIVVTWIAALCLTVPFWRWLARRGNL
jgi:hypothetical protein